MEAQVPVLLRMDRLLVRAVLPNHHHHAHLGLRSVPSLVLAIEFLYHPAPMDGPSPQADIATPDKESSLLGPLRFLFLELWLKKVFKKGIWENLIVMISGTNLHFCLSPLFNALNLLPCRANEEEPRSLPLHIFVNMSTLAQLQPQTHATLK